MDQRIIQLTSLVRELSLGIVNRALYPASHHRVTNCLSRASAVVRVLEEMGESFPLLVGVAEGKIVFDHRPLLGASLYAKKFAAALESRESGGVQILPGATDRDFAALFELLADPDERARDVVALNMGLEQAAAKGIRFVTPLVKDEEGEAAELWDELDRLRVVEVPLHLYQNLLDLLQTTAVRVTRDVEIEMDRVYDVAGQVLHLLQEQPDAMAAVAYGGQADNYNFLHSVRVCLRTCLVARELVDDQELLLRICRAALLHDVGKAMIPDEILMKKGRLTENEMAEMRLHAEHGARILLGQGHADPLAVRVAFSHHLGYDGTGYPDVPAGFEVDWVTRLVQVCDVFEALTSERPYKDELSPGEAFTVLLDIRERFHPAVLRQFIRIVGLYPMGTMVRLETGEAARVTGASSDFHRPRIRILTEADGETPLDRDEGEIDLADPKQGEGRSIAGILRSTSLLDGMVMSRV